MDLKFVEQTTYLEALTILSEVINKVKGTVAPYFRPTSLNSVNSDVHKVQDKILTSYKDLMEVCWSEDTTARPTFSYIKQAMGKLDQEK